MTTDQTIARAMEITQLMHDLSMTPGNVGHMRVLVDDLSGVLDRQEELLADRGNVVPFFQ